MLKFYLTVTFSKGDIWTIKYAKTYLYICTYGSANTCFLIKLCLYVSGKQAFSFNLIQSHDTKKQKTEKRLNELNKKQAYIFLQIWRNLSQMQKFIFMHMHAWVSMEKVQLLAVSTVTVLCQIPPYYNYCAVKVGKVGQGSDKAVLLFFFLSALKSWFLECYPFW